MLDQLLVHICDVIRPVPSKGTSGGEETVDEDVYLDLPVSAQPISAQWASFYAQNQLKTSHTFYTNVTTIKVKVGDKVLYNCRTFMVVGVRNLIELNRVLALDLLEVT